MEKQKREDSRVDAREEALFCSTISARLQSPGTLLCSALPAPYLIQKKHTFHVHTHTGHTKNLVSGLVTNSRRGGIKLEAAEIPNALQ